jgi:glycosyltransferase involved in cell wall biosynthesis
MGHKVKGICLSYRKCKTGSLLFKAVEGGEVEWNTFNLISGFPKYLKYLNHQLRFYKPDVIMASSDCFHTILGVALGKMYRIPCIIDLYDNYESYKLSKFTLIIPLYRFFLKRADAICCISKYLKQYLVQTCQPKGKIRIIGNAINQEHFFSRSLIESRDHFGIPENITIIGTAGALDENRGIANLYRAFEVLVETNNNLYLAVAGVGSRDDRVFQLTNVIDLGVLPYDDIPFFYNMLDIAVICLITNDFGQYCFPQKVNEILACKTPVIAANVGVMGDLFNNNTSCLFNSEDWGDLVDKLQLQLKYPQVPNMYIDTWTKQAERMEKFMIMIVNNYCTGKAKI